MNTRAEQINFEQAVYDAFGRVTDFTLAMRIARYFYEQADKDTKAELLEWAKDMKEANEGVCNTSYYQEFIDKIESL